MTNTQTASAGDIVRDEHGQRWRVTHDDPHFNGPDHERAVVAVVDIATGRDRRVLLASTLTVIEAHPGGAR